MTSSNATMSTLAVAGLDLTIWPGEIFGILGPNGAGKTTTLEMLEGLRAPDSGTMRVAGFDPVTEPERVHRVIGVQLQTTALFDYLNCGEIVALFAALYGADASAARVEQLAGAGRPGGEAAGRASTPSPAGSSSGWPSPWPWSTRRASPSSTSRPPDSTRRRGACSGRPIRDIRAAGRHGRPDDPLHGRSRAALRPHRHHGPRPGRRLRHAARAHPRPWRRRDRARRTCRARR